MGHVDASLPGGIGFPRLFGKYHTVPERDVHSLTVFTGFKPELEGDGSFVPQRTGKNVYCGAGYDSAGTAAQICGERKLIVPRGPLGKKFGIGKGGALQPDTMFERHIAELESPELHVYALWRICKPWAFTQMVDIEAGATRNKQQSRKEKNTMSGALFHELIPFSM